MESLQGRALADLGPVLVVDPRIRFLHTIPKPDAGLPAERTLDFRIVTVSPIHSLGSVQIVIAFHLYARNLFDDVYQPVDRR